MSISDKIELATIAIFFFRMIEAIIHLSRGMKAKKSVLLIKPCYRCCFLFFRFCRRRGCLIRDDFVEKQTI